MKHNEPKILEREACILNLPSVDQNKSTRIQCILALAFGVLASIACIICGAVMPKLGPDAEFGLVYGIPTTFGPASIEAVTFCINLVLTQCLESLSYIHSLSLRWALMEDNRLQFNTNIRLFTSSKKSLPNRWYTNILSATCLISCYAATSQLFLPEVHSRKTYVNCVALWTIGIGLLGQAALGLWCLWANLRRIPTWGSNPLNTVICALNSGYLQHRPGRCMLSIQFRDTAEPKQTLPQLHQPRQIQVIQAVKRVVIYVWTLTTLAIIWFLTMVFVARTDANYLTWGWFFTPTWSTLDLYGDVVTTYDDNSGSLNIVSLGMSPDINNETASSMPLVVQLVFGILFVFALQSLQTLGLHCAELVVNVSRDEDAWRALAKKSTRKNVLATPAFMSALLNWKYLVLFVWKSTLHWLFGQSLAPSYYNFEGCSNSACGSHLDLNISYGRLFAYAICSIVFAIFITYLAFERPKGPQPAAWGNLQTLADLVDDWELDHYARFWWGDKGQSGGGRHAGMSARKEELAEIQLEALYS